MGEQGWHAADALTSDGGTAAADRRDRRAGPDLRSGTGTLKPDLRSEVGEHVGITEIGAVLPQGRGGSPPPLWPECCLLSEIPDGMTPRRGWQRRRCPQLQAFGCGCGCVFGKVGAQVGGDRQGQVDADRVDRNDAHLKSGACEPVAAGGGHHRGRVGDVMKEREHSRTVPAACGQRAPSCRKG